MNFVFLKTYLVENYYASPIIIPRNLLYRKSLALLPLEDRLLFDCRPFCWRAKAYQLWFKQYFPLLTVTAIAILSVLTLSLLVQNRALAGANHVGHRPTVEASTDSADRTGTTAQTPPFGGAIVQTRRKGPQFRRPKQLRLRLLAAPSELRSLCPASVRTMPSLRNPSPPRIRQQSKRSFRSPAAGARPSPVEAKASPHRQRPNPRDRRAQATRIRRSWHLFKQRDLPRQACRRVNQQCCRRLGRRLGFQLGRLGCQRRHRQ